MSIQFFTVSTLHQSKPLETAHLRNFCHSCVDYVCMWR